MTTSNHALEHVQRTLIRGALSILAAAVLGCTVAALLPGCVTSGDLRQVADSIDAYHDGQITRETLKEEVSEVAETVDERTDGFLEDLSTGSPILDLLIAAGTATAGAVATKKAAEKSVNRKRDERRKQRGEPVA